MFSNGGVTQGKIVVGLTVWRGRGRACAKWWWAGGTPANCLSKVGHIQTSIITHSILTIWSTYYLMHGFTCRLRRFCQFRYDFECACVLSWEESTSAGKWPSKELLPVPESRFHVPNHPARIHRTALTRNAPGHVAPTDLGGFLNLRLLGRLVPCRLLSLALCAVRLRATR